MGFVRGLHQDFEKCVAIVREYFFNFSNADGTCSPSKINEVWTFIKLAIHSFTQNGDSVIKSYLENPQNITPNKPLSERKPEGEEREFYPLDDVLPGENFQRENNGFSLEKALPITNSENESDGSFLEKSLTALCGLIKNEDTEGAVIDIMAHVLNEAQPKGNFEPKDLTQEQIENIENNITVLCTFVDDESDQAKAKKIKTELFSFIEKKQKSGLTSAIPEASSELGDLSLKGKLNKLKGLIGETGDVATIPHITMSRLKDGLSDFEQLSPQDRETIIKRLNPILESLSLFVKNLPTGTSRINEMLGSIASDLGIRLDVASIEKRANGEKEAFKKIFSAESVDALPIPQVGAPGAFNLIEKLSTISYILERWDLDKSNLVNETSEISGCEFLNLNNSSEKEQCTKIKKLRRILANITFSGEKIKDDSDSMSILDAIAQIIIRASTDMGLCQEASQLLNVNMLYQSYDPEKTEEENKKLIRKNLIKWGNQYSGEFTTTKPTNSQQNENGEITKIEYLYQEDFIKEEIQGTIIPNRGAGDCFLRSIVQNLLPSSIFIAREEENVFVGMVRTGLSRFATRIISDRKKRSLIDKENSEKNLKEYEDELKKIKQENSSEGRTVKEKQDEIEKEKNKIRRFDIEIQDAENLKGEIERISRMEAEIESDSVLIRFLSILIKRPIVVFSEFTKNPGYVTYISPDGNSVSLSFNDLRKNPSALRQAIFIYHTGNNKEGHYELVYPLNNIGQ